MKFTFAPEATPLAGYTIKRAIDRGGFGEVYYALSDSGKEVALKLLQRNQQIELRGVRQCLNLKHPNLVAIFDIKTDADDDHWVVMEFVAGKSLEQVLAENPRGLPLDEIESWLAGMATGTAFLHDRGIVHRDLKPANVFRENGIVKIGDVGLSKFITPSRRSAQTESVGTVYYMAPEVARGKYGSELDVYSLGVILYEMLTGSVPFAGESTGEILMKHMTEAPDLSKIPTQFRTVVGQALEKDPQRRTPGAARLLENFRQARLGKQIAIEIPASHFVDVPQLERSGVLKPASPPPGARPRSAETPTTHYPNEAEARGKPQRVPQPPSPDFGRAVQDFFNKLGAEIRQRPWLAIVICLGVFVVFPRFSRGGAIGLAKGEFLIVAAVSLFTFFAVKSAVGKSQSAAVGGPRVPPSPQPPPRPPVITPRVVTPQIAPAVGRAAARKPAPPPNPDSLRPLTFTQRVSDLSGAMTMAVVWGIAATTAVSGLVRHFPWVSAEQDLLTTPAALGIFGLTTIVGSWAILLASKLFEGTGTSSRERRLIQMALGAAVGAVAYGLHQDLLTDLPLRSTFPGFIDHIGHYSLTTSSSPNQPSLAGFVVYFAALFGIRRWWLLADAYRSRRFRFGSMLFTGMIAFVIPAAFVFQQNWGVLWGVAISTVVQLSAPWTAPSQRPPVA